MDVLDRANNLHRQGTTFGLISGCSSRERRVVPFNVRAASIRNEAAVRWKKEGTGDADFFSHDEWVKLGTDAELRELVADGEVGNRPSQD